MKTHSSPGRELWAGAQAALPLALGILPFMTIYGVLMHAAGFSPLVAQAMSLLVFASAPLVAAQMLLLGSGSLLSPVTFSQLVAASLAARVAWRFQNVALTVATGMVALWVVQALISEGAFSW